VYDEQKEGLTDAELYAVFDRFGLMVLRVLTCSPTLRRTAGTTCLDRRRRWRMSGMSTRHSRWNRRRNYGANGLLLVGHLLGQPRRDHGNERAADIGSFRGAFAFLDEYLSSERNTCREGGHMPSFLLREDLAPGVRAGLRQIEGAGRRLRYPVPEQYLTGF
jgi:hypothetical protein